VNFGLGTSLPIIGCESKIDQLQGWLDSLRSNHSNARFMRTVVGFFLIARAPTTAREKPYSVYALAFHCFFFFLQLKYPSLWTPAEYDQESSIRKTLTSIPLSRLKAMKSKLSINPVFYHYPALSFLDYSSFLSSAL
jgi:hypothetical protein